MNQRFEQGIVNQIQTFLTLRKIPHYRVRNVRNIVTRNGRTFFGRSRFNQNGAPDFFAWHDKKAYAIEVKSKTGRLTPEQTTWLGAFQALGGGQVIIARSLEDVQRGMGL